MYGLKELRNLFLKTVLRLTWCSILQKWLLFSASTELNGWMRYDGFYLSGHTRKVLPYAASDIACWESCLQETSFLCLALAYATRGNRTCLLYNTKALFHYANWISAIEMTYYEYCQNGNTKCCYSSSNKDAFLKKKLMITMLNVTGRSVVAPWRISKYTSISFRASGWCRTEYFFGFTTSSANAHRYLEAYITRFWKPFFQASSDQQNIVIINDNLTRSNNSTN